MGHRRPSDASGDWIGTLVSVEVDRPLGSRHPRFHETIYQVNYGYVPGTQAADGQEVDAYVLGVPDPVAQVRGRCIAIIHRLDDVEDKLIVVPPDVVRTDAEIRRDVHFQEQYFQTVILR